MKKIDWTKPVRTKNGWLVEIISTNARGNFPVLGYIGKYKNLTFWDENGKSPEIEADNHDLENIPEEQTIYVNIYRDQQDFYASSYRNRTEADKAASNKRIARVKVKFVEGQFDD